ncbi:MAG: FAD binding domain-containing protein [Chloroflexota bacterium]
MSHFSYARAHSLPHAITLLNEPGLRSRVLAGGTDLVNQFRSGAVACDRVVDVAHVPELRTIDIGEQIVIGAAATHAEIAENAGLQQHAPFLAHACRQIGSPQIRNVATIGGNVINAAACADTLPVLVCLDAEAILVTATGERRLPVAELVTGVSRTALPAGALVRAFVFAPPPPNSRTAFQRIGRRRAMSIARLSLAAMAARDATGKIGFVRLAAGAALARCRRAVEIEALLLGRQPEAGLFSQAGQRMAQLLREESGGRWSAAYKERVIATLTERALKEVLAP